MVKTTDANNYNIFNDVPNIMETAIQDIKPIETNPVQTNQFVDSVEISKDKLSNVTEKLNDYNIYNKPVQPISSIEGTGNTISYSTRPDVEKTNINVDPDKIVINNKNAISDDAFFDDFFGEDE